MDYNSKPKIVTNNNTKTNASVKDDKKDDKKDEPIPNSLTITINTSVPGYQTIKYKPNMTIKDIDKDEKTVWFDPLVQLEQSVIDKVPESIRVLEFFNKGLFESLINAHGNKKQIKLEQAKRNKIVDNNIQITLNNLFPTNGILYIKGEPYAIADIQWTKSNWKIDRKITEIPQVDTNKITDPIAYNAMIKNEVNEGNRQLLMIPKDLLYGVNFNKETEELSSVDREKELIDKSKELEEERLKAEAEAKAKELEEAKIKAKAEAKAKELEEAKIKAEAEAKLRAEEAAKKQPRPILQIDQGPQPPKPPLQIDQGPQPPKPPLQIDQGPKPPLQIDQVLPPPKPPKPSKPSKPALQLEDIAAPVEQKIEEIENIQMSQEFLPKLLLSKNSTKVVRQYFENNDYYSMVSTIYKYMPTDSKNYVTNIFKNTTNIDVKESFNISRAAYNFTITGTKISTSNGSNVKKQFTDGLRVISNAGGGNCLFIAISDAINYYNNKSNIDNKILYNMYGNGNNLFTTAVLRNIVSTEIITLFNSNQNFHNDCLQEGQINLDNLNDTFERVITSSLTSSVNNDQDYYDTTLIDIYNSQDNFFVIIPANIEKRNRPFKLVENNDEIKSYIESKYYWADNKTIDILRKKLKLNIIVIKNENNKFTLPYPNMQINQNDNWDKYLFLYNTENHYELMTFDYLLKSKKNGKFVPLKKIIFRVFENNYILDPPFYILFFMFGTYYLKTLGADSQVLFFNSFYVLYSSLQNITQHEERTENIEKFISDIKKYFGPFNENLFIGGAINNNYSNYNKYNKYSNINRGSPSFLKKEEKQDNIQISFHITIDMELQKGTTLSKEQMSNIKCIKGWNKVRKSFAEFTGRKYVIPPVYENLSDKYNKKEKEEDKTITKKTGGKRRRKTRKIYRH